MNGEWGANWLASWVATPPVRRRSALVVELDEYGNPSITLGHFDPATGWHDINYNAITVTHWMALPPLPVDVSPAWANQQQYTVEQYKGDDARKRKHAAEMTP